METSAKIHVSSGTSDSFVLTETPVGSQCEAMMLRLRDRPRIGCSPVLGLGQNVTEVWPIENTGVLPFKPVIEPGKRLGCEDSPTARRGHAAPS